MKPYRIGVIGIGDISDVYINNLKKYDLVEVVACAARNLEKAQAKALQHNIPKAYASGHDLIADPDIDIVLNLTTPNVHFEYNQAALEAGKHVYTEKPLASTFVEASKLVEMAAAKNLYLGSAPDTFLGGRLQTCRQLIDEGKIGDIIGASAFVNYHGPETFHPNPDFFYKKGAGPLLDIGPYYLTAMLSLMGPIKTCAGMASKPFATRTIESLPLRGQTIDVEVDTHITGTYQFESGAIATILTSFDVWDSELPRLEIYGTLGTISIRDIDPLDGPNLFGGEILLRTKETYRWNDMPRGKALPEGINVPVARPFSETSHQTNSRGIGLVDMAYAIRDQRALRASGQMALHQLEAMEGLLKAAHEQQYYQMQTTFEQPAPLPVNFPASEK